MLNSTQVTETITKWLLLLATNVKFKMEAQFAYTKGGHLHLEFLTKVHFVLLVGCFKYSTLELSKVPIT